MGQKYIIETDDMRDIIAFNESKKLLGILDDLLSGMRDSIIETLHKHGLSEKDQPAIEFLNAMHQKMINIRKQSDALRYTKDGKIIT